MNERRRKTQNRSKFCKMILTKMEKKNKKKQIGLPNLIENFQLGFN